jgi:hypothetical protein
MSIYRKRGLGVDGTPGLSVDEILENFRGRLPSDELTELERKLREFESEGHDGRGRWGGRARPPGRDAGPVPFVGEPVGGFTRNQRLIPEREINPARGERMAGDAVPFEAMFPGR